MDKIVPGMQAVHELQAEFKEHAEAAALFLRDDGVPKHPLFAAQSFAEAASDIQAIQKLWSSLCQNMKKGKEALKKNLTDDEFYGCLQKGEEYAALETDD
jgi:hypothetical protein